MEIGARAMEMVWIGALAGPPLAVLTGLVCVLGRCRPATKHALWTAALVSFVVPAVAGGVWRADWFRTPGASQAAAELADHDKPVIPNAVEKPVVEARLGEAVVEADVVEAGAVEAYVVDEPERVFSETPVVAEEESCGEVEEEVASDEGACEDEAFAGAGEATEELVSIGAGAAEAVDAAVPADEMVAASGSRNVGVEGAMVEEAGVVEAWLTQGLVVRDAVAAMPPIPSMVWLIGAGVVVVVMWARSWSLYRVVRRGEAGDAEVVGMVASAAAEMGLRRVPETVMVEERVSPMIWCGVRPRLVLPRELWGELDGASRRAVICHELAHVKRRDHWLCWVEAGVRVMYWWHPVVWWVCRRVREEADASCDVWVTSLMPRCRRAYAEALIATRSYLNVPDRRVPVGLGVMSNRSKRLARRLTMVMTQKARPRVSAVGTFLALGVIAAGMFVMPGLACPPDEQAKAKSTKAGRAVKVITSAGGPTGLAVVGAKAGEDCEAACTTTCEGQGPAVSGGAGVPEVAFFGEAPALEAMMGGDEGAMRRLEERLRRLEEQLRTLEKQGQWRGSPSSMNVPSADALSTAAAQRAIADAQRRVADEVRAASARVYATTRDAFAEHAAAAELAGRGAVNSQASGATATGGAARAASPLVIVTEGPTHTEEYRLPEGKLRAMIALMERDDVPVFIERHSDKIVVHGTDSQHRVFRAFVELINPGTEKDAGAVPGMSGGRGGAVAPRAASSREAELRAKARDVGAQRRQMEQRAKEMERKAERAKSRSEKLREQSEATEERADSAVERASEESNEARKAQLLAQADALRAQANKLEADAQNAEAEADKIEAEADALEQAAEDLEEAAEDLEDAIEDLVEGDDADEVSGSMPAMPAMPAMAPMPSSVAATAPGSMPSLPAPVARYPGLAPMPTLMPVAPVAPIAPVAPVAPVLPIVPAAPTAPAGGR